MLNKYLLVGDIETVMNEDKTFTTKAVIIGKGDSLAEATQQMTYKGLQATGQIYKLINVELVEKK